MANIFESERLLYRAIEPEDLPLFEALRQDPVTLQNSDIRFPVPQSKKASTEYQRWVTEETLLGVVMCLQPPRGESANTDPDGKPQAIGIIHLRGTEARMQHHRHAEIGITILADFQGKGYGSEAIRWILRWAFVSMGLHRVQIRAAEWNTGARELYERLGFQPEGRWREAVWHDGRWWDSCSFAMLDREWQEQYGQALPIS